LCVIVLKKFLSPHPSLRLCLGVGFWKGREGKERFGKGLKLEGFELL
jgi:hypothetical protein